MSPRAAGAAATLALAAAMASPALAHPVNMSCIAHRFQVRVAPDGIDVEVFLRYFEFPSQTQRLRMDADGDGEVSSAELKAYGRAIDAELAQWLVVTVDGRRVPLHSSYPPVIDLMGESRVVPCHHVQRSLLTASVAAPAGRLVVVTFETKAFPENPGFFRHRVIGDGVTIRRSTVVELPEVDPESVLAPGPEIRRIEFAYSLGEVAAEAAPRKEAPPAAAGPPRRRHVRPDTFMVGLRVFQRRVAAYFKGEFSLWAFAALLLAAFAYGGVHALAPGHAKTITAAYLIGSHATPWHAVLLGIVVTASHTWSILALALVTHLFYGGEVRPETHGAVMAVSGGLIVLLGLGQFASRLRGRGFLHHHGPGGHTHVHGAADHHHAHEHPHDAHAHHDPIKSLVFLGFSGGIVPCPGALWIYFLALSLHRTFEGILLITALGAGLAVVLTAVGLVTVRVRRGLERRRARIETTGLQERPLVGRAAAWLARWLALIAPCVLVGVGLLIVVWGLLSAGVIGGP